MKAESKTKTTTPVDENEAAAVTAATTSTQKNEVESNIQVDENASSDENGNGGSDDRTPETKKLKAMFNLASTNPPDDITKISIDPAAAVIAPLTVAEIKEFVECESTIDKGFQTFVEVGKALARIRDGVLFRQTHPTFDAYLDGKWGYTKQRASQLILASEAHMILSERVDKSTMPKHERAMRELLKAPSDKRAEILRIAAMEGEATTERIKIARAQLMPKRAKTKNKKMPTIKIAAAVKAAERLAAFLSVDALSADDCAALKEVSTTIEARIKKLKLAA